MSRQGSHGVRSGTPLWLARFPQTPSAPAASPLAEKGRRALNPPQIPRCEIAVPHPSHFPSESAAAWPAPRIEGGSTESYFLRCGTRDSRDDIRNAVPLFDFRWQSTLACRCETVILCCSIVFRLVPFASDPGPVVKAIQGGIQRALLNLQTIF